MESDDQFDKLNEWAQENGITPPPQASAPATVPAIVSPSDTPAAWFAANQN